MARARPPDVLTAYRLINEVGGLADRCTCQLPSHQPMLDLILADKRASAYTQDEKLCTQLEVTDLRRNRAAARSCFSGTKPEYPVKMHCIQGSGRASREWCISGTIKISRRGLNRPNRKLDSLKFRSTPSWMC